MNFKKDTRLILLILFALTLPNSVAIHNIIAALLFFYWLFFQKNKKEIFYLIKYNPVVFFFYLFFITFSISILWSSNIKWGLHIINKEILFLILPIFMQLIKENEKHLLIKTFIFAMTFSEIISYAVHFKIIPPIFHATPYDPTPFMSHISYNPFLAFTIYLLIYYFMTTKESLFIKIISIIFIITMSINLFITGGRAGQVAFFVVMFIAFIQFFKVNFKTAIIFITIVLAVFFSAYKFSNIFHQRVNLAITNIKNYNKNPNTSIGLRITFWKNTLKIIKQHPIIGVGIGDYPKEYKKINKIKTPKLANTVQPHNMYLFVWASGGILPLIALIAILFSEILLGIKSSDDLKYIRVTLPIISIVIMFSDSYLLGYFTTTLFIFFSAILFKGFTWKDLIKS